MAGPTIRTILCLQEWSGKALPKWVVRSVFGRAAVPPGLPPLSGFIREIRDGQFIDTVWLRGRRGGLVVGQRPAPARAALPIVPTRRSYHISRADFCAIGFQVFGARIDRIAGNLSEGAEIFAMWAAPLISGSVLCRASAARLIEVRMWVPVWDPCVAGILAAEELAC